VLGDRASGTYLRKLAWTKIVRHQLVSGTASPDDPALTEYWAERRRRGALPPMSKAVVSQPTTAQHLPESLWGLLEPDAVTSRKSGSQGVAAQQRAAATRQIETLAIEDLLADRLPPRRARHCEGTKKAPKATTRSRNTTTSAVSTTSNTRSK
jgi:hypothetical protein